MGDYSIRAYNPAVPEKEEISLDLNLKWNQFFDIIDIDYFMDVVKCGAVKSYDRAFEICVCHACFSEEYGFLNIGKNSAKKTVCAGRRECLQHLEKIGEALPAGVMLRIEQSEDELGDAFDLYKYARRCVIATITVYASVTADYSKKCYEANSVGHITHDVTAFQEFISAARSFKDRILSTRRSTIQEIKNNCGSNPLLVEFSGSEYVINNHYPSSTYHSHGMANLGNLEQCYGLAWAVAEMSVPTRRCRLILTDDGSVYIKWYSKKVEYTKW